MKHTPYWFPVCPLPLIPVITITFLILFLQYGRGQTLAGNTKANYNTESAGQVVAMLDQSSLINSGYTTFLGYSLEGTSHEVSIQIVDRQGNLVKAFAVEPDNEGSVTLPANMLREGNYQLQMIVDGKQKCARDLRVVR